MRSAARKRDEPVVVTISAVEWASALAEAWDKGYAAGMDWEESGGPYSEFHDHYPRNPYGSAQ